MESLSALIQMPSGATTPSENWKRYLASIRRDVESYEVKPGEFFDDDPKGFAVMFAKLYTRETRGGKGLLLRGVPGSGKSARLRFIADRLNIAMIPAADFLKNWKEMDETLFREYCKVVNPRWDVVPRTFNDLIIDDLGTEDEEINDYGVKTDVMRKVIEKRYDVFPRWKTHFTTNLDDTQIQDRYGQRCWSKLNEMCAFVSMKSGDRRLLNTQH